MNQELLRQNLEITMQAGKPQATFSAHPDGQWVHITDLKRWLEQRPVQAPMVTDEMIGAAVQAYDQQHEKNWKGEGQWKHPMCSAIAAVLKALS